MRMHVGWAIREIQRVLSEVNGKGIVRIERR